MLADAVKSVLASLRRSGWQELASAKIKGMNGKMVEFEGNGHPYAGYLSPSVNGSGPGVVVIQEYWGLVGHIKSVADRLAAEGFTVLAPDFYHGETTDEPDEAGSMMMALNIADAEKVIRGAVTFLLDHPASTGPQVGVVGFCMGGQLSLFAACLDNRIGACVDYYGIHPKVHPDFEKLEAPVLGFFAEHDEYATPEAVKALDAELTKYGKKHNFLTYPNTHHAFFNDDRPEVYNQSAAENSWDKMLALFEEKLS